MGGKVSSDEASLTVEGTRLPVHAERRIQDPPLSRIDVVIDCTGAFGTEAKLAPYFAAGVKRVVVSAPVKDGNAANLVYGINQDTYDPARHRIVTAARCATNCLARSPRCCTRRSASATARHAGEGLRRGTTTRWATVVGWSTWR